MWPIDETLHHEKLDVQGKDWEYVVFEDERVFRPVNLKLASSSKKGLFNHLSKFPLEKRIGFFSISTLIGNY